MTHASGTNGSDDTAETRIAELSPDELRVLSALAVVGRATLSADELAAVTVAADAGPLVDDLERRGLVQQDGETKRYSTLERVGAEIRETDAAFASAERLLGYLKTLAKTGDLSPGRLAEEAEAILGLSEWAAEHEEWQGLLELVQTTQSCFSIARRLEEWIPLLHRGRAAAQALGDRDAEVQLLHQLAQAHTAAGDARAARRYLREADDVQRGRPPSGRRGPPGPEDSVARAAGEAGSRLPRALLWTIGLLAAAGAGLAAGYAISNNGSIGTTTAELTVTATVGGRTITTTKETTLPATTVLSTVLETTTVATTTTVLSTTTVFTTTTPVVR